MASCWNHFFHLRQAKQITTSRVNERFDVIRRLGSGGMGFVYEVNDRHRDARVAQKTLSKVDPDEVYRFKNEFRGLEELLVGWSRESMDNPQFVAILTGWYVDLYLGEYAQVWGRMASEWPRAARAGMFRSEYNRVMACGCALAWPSARFRHRIQPQKFSQVAESVVNRMRRENYGVVETKACFVGVFSYPESRRAQLCHRKQNIAHFSKLDVAGSNPVSRSSFFNGLQLFLQCPVLILAA
jgi:hypothetical protein